MPMQPRVWRRAYTGSPVLFGVDLEELLVGTARSQAVKLGRLTSDEF
jgi:hypothetical protein